MKKPELAKKQIQEILDKNGLVIKSQISFPIYKELPDEVKLAINVLTKHGMKVIYFLDKK